MTVVKSSDILRDKSRNKSIAFTRDERLRLGLQGLLPHAVATQAQLVSRVMESLRRLPRDIDRYMALSSMQERNERLFYRTVIDHIDEIMPLIYTPTVGEACREFSHIAREPKGFFITPDDKGRIGRILGNWPEKDIRVIVVTDGQRILGLGDLGAEQIVSRMSAHNERPVLFALSNPTSRAECTADQVYAWSHGRAVFASGSPFGAVTYNGSTFQPGQGNNAYVFPGIGLGAVVSRARIIPDEFFLAAARKLARLVKDGDLKRGSLYPPLRDIRKISLTIAVSVAEKAFAMKLARAKRPRNLKNTIARFMYQP